MKSFLAVFKRGIQRVRSKISHGPSSAAGMSSLQWFRGSQYQGGDPVKIAFVDQTGSFIAGSKGG